MFTKITNKVTIWIYKTILQSIGSYGVEAWEISAKSRFKFHVEGVEGLQDKIGPKM